MRPRLAWLRVRWKGHQSVQTVRSGLGKRRERAGRGRPKVGSPALLMRASEGSQAAGPACSPAKQGHEGREGRRRQGWPSFQFSAWEPGLSQDWEPWRFWRRPGEGGGGRLGRQAAPEAAGASPGQRDGSKDSASRSTHVAIKGLLGTTGESERSRSVRIVRCPRLSVTDTF